MHDLVKRKTLGREPHMILPVVILHFLLYRAHSLLVPCVFLLNRLEGLSEMLQWTILLLLIWRWKVIIDPDSGGLPAWSITATSYLRVSVDHVISGVDGTGSHSLVFNGRHLPRFHSLIDVKLDKLLWACFSSSVFRNRKTIHWFLKSLFSQLDFFDLSQ